MAEEEAADRPRQVPGGKGREGGHQRNEQRAGGKDRRGDVAREDSEHDEVVELERAAETREDDDLPSGARQAGRGVRPIGGFGIRCL
jgi:hypothetical protein